MSFDVSIEAAVVADTGPLLVVQRSAYVCEAQPYEDARIPPHNIRLYERHGYAPSRTQQLNEQVTFVHMTRVRPAG